MGCFDGIGLSQVGDRADEHPQRPDIGTEPHFKKKKPPTEYRYDYSLAPELSWNENLAREQAEASIAKILESESLEELRPLHLS